MQALAVPLAWSKWPLFSRDINFRDLLGTNLRSEPYWYKWLESLLDLILIGADAESCRIGTRGPDDS
jgi:hypothetical protein